MHLPADTDRQAHEAQLAALRRLGPEGRVAMAVRLSEEARTLVEYGVRSRHPQYSERQVQLAVFRLCLGSDIIREVWGEEGLVAP